MLTLFLQPRKQKRPCRESLTAKIAEDNSDKIVHYVNMFQMNLKWGKTHNDKYISEEEFNINT